MISEMNMKINYVMFDVTDHCNFSCKHCYKSQPDQYCDLSVTMIKSFFNMLKGKGFFPSVVISGGEPLLYKDLFILLDYLKDRKSVKLNTNGVLLNKYYKEFLKYPNLKIQVSLDGYDDDSFFQIRNTHMFERIVENTEIAYNAGLDVYFRATLTNKTISNYKLFINLSEQSQVPLVIRPMYNTGATEQQELKINFEELCKWQQEIIENNLIKYTGGRNLISESSCPILHDHTVYSTLTVDNYGNVFPCQLLRSAMFKMGNIYTDSFDMIFSKNDTIVSLLKNIIESSSCKKCGFRKRFGDGTCVTACYLGNKLCVKEKILRGY